MSTLFLAKYGMQRQSYVVFTAMCPPSRFHSIAIGPHSHLIHHCLHSSSYNAIVRSLVQVPSYDSVAATSLNPKDQQVMNAPGPSH